MACESSIMRMLGSGGDARPLRALRLSLTPAKQQILPRTRVLSAIAESCAAYHRMSESPEDVRREASVEDDKEEDAPEVADEKEKDEDVPDAEEEHANGVDDKEKDDGDRSPSPRARSMSRDRDASRSPDSRSPVRSFFKSMSTLL